MQCFIVDAFTDDQLAGNAAAVVIMPEKKDVKWMQAVAAEFQQAETAFLHQAEAGSSWELRWFTPTTEVDLCGHATLASAHVIWQYLGASTDTLAFATKSGTLYADRRETASGTQQIALNFPIGSLAPLTLDRAVVESLALQPVAGLLAGPDLLLVLPNPSDVRDYQPDFNTIASLPWRGLIITSRHADGELDFVSRFFAPKLGILEDPVTGAIHCYLAPYWSERLGKSSLLAEQWSARGGRLHLQVLGERVQLAGQARTFLEGRLSQ